MNKVILMGRLTKDPEVRYSQGSEPLAVARYTLAVNRRLSAKASPMLTLSTVYLLVKQANSRNDTSKKARWLVLLADSRFVPGMTTRARNAGVQT